MKSFPNCPRRTQRDCLKNVQRLTTSQVGEFSKIKVVALRSSFKWIVITSKAEIGTNRYEKRNGGSKPRLEHSSELIRDSNMSNALGN